jgi:DmsE family decaheme c-type cytochrome
MSRRIRAIRPGTWLICGFLVWLGAFVSVRAGGAQPQGLRLPSTQKPAPAQNPPQAAAPATQKPAAGYAGEDTCVTCHEAQKSGRFQKSKHAAKADPRSPAGKQSCETCHGPGAKHAEDPVGTRMRTFGKGQEKGTNELCTSCHNRDQHALWAGSQHETRGLSCTTCHSVHTPKSEEKQLKEVTQRELCATCHRDKIAKLDRSGHMPVREQKMECTSCHNVHGSTNVRLLRKGDSIAELCTSCHAEKRGPFLWEHAPSRDGCVTCHDPHGSSNERMLVAKPPLLCQRCHVATRHPSTIYDAQAIGAASSPSVRVYARSCVTCHSAIHGSNHPSGQRFIR